MQKGDLSAAIDLRKLAKIKHLYALGPVEGLKGEVTIWDGKPSIARVADGKVATSDRFEVKACFLVYASVPAWQEIAIPSNVRDLEQLEAFVAQAAAKAKLDVHRPFPFAVRGKFEKLAFHVVNKTDDSPHSREKHERVKVHFTADNAAARLIGFYSDHHHGVFTHHGSNVHIHVITDDNKRSGHVESIRLGVGCVLLLPMR
jgi:acetolactate decarboxylase